MSGKNALENERIARGYLAALQAGDLDAVAGFLSPHVRIVEPAGLPYAGVKHGIDGFREFSKEVCSKYFENFRVEAKTVFVNGDYAAFYFVMTGNLPGGGKPLRTEVVEILEFEDGLISCFKPFYFDTKTLAESLSG